jgi:hypothetical protein
LGIYLKEYKSIYKRDTLIPMFITALFTIAKEKWNYVIHWKMDGTGDHHVERSQAQKAK